MALDWIYIWISLTSKWVTSYNRATNNLYFTGEILSLPQYWLFLQTFLDNTPIRQQIIRNIIEFYFQGHAFLMSFPEFLLSSFFRILDTFVTLPNSLLLPKTYIFFYFTPFHILLCYCRLYKQLDGKWKDWFDGRWLGKCDLFSYMRIELLAKSTKNSRRDYTVSAIV